MDQNLTALNEAESPGWFEVFLGAAACTVLFGPLLTTVFYFAEPGEFHLDAAIETVGVGVILRAMIRRLFRSGTRSVLQTAVGTVTRASSRTMTRRIVRVGVKSVTMLFRRNPTESVTAVDAPPIDNDEPVTARPPQSSAWAVSMGFVALVLSLGGIFLLLNVEHSPQSTEPSKLAEVLGGMSITFASLLGALPLVVYAGLLTVAARTCGAQVRFRTDWEALLLQAYFTGSGSYLPLSTDSEITGTPAARARLAVVSLGGLFILHLATWALGYSFASYPLDFISGMFLLYCFVFSFPIAPLDGYYLWAYSRWLWLAIWIPILASFLLTLPEPLHVIL